MNAQELKAELRNTVLAKRNALSEVERIEKSLAASQLASEQIEFDPGCIISAFFPIRSEIDPRPIMDKLRINGARLCLPVVSDKTTIVFRELVRGGELIDTGFGTRGPSESAEVLDPSILLMPLSAFDSKGNRIGYGAGHYDRAIERLEKKGILPRLIGLAFDLQQVETVPAEPHDKPLDAIITESGFRSF